MLMPNKEQRKLSAQELEELRLALAVEWLAAHAPAIRIKRLCPISVEIGRFTVGFDLKHQWCVWETDPERPDYCSRLVDQIEDPASAVALAAGLALTNALETWIATDPVEQSS